MGKLIDRELLGIVLAMLGFITLALLDVTSNDLITREASGYTVIAILVIIAWSALLGLVISLFMTKEFK